MIMSDNFVSGQMDVKVLRREAAYVEYYKAHLLVDYDRSPELREQHDIEATWKTARTVFDDSSGVQQIKFTDAQRKEYIHRMLHTGSKKLCEIEHSV